MGRIRPERHPRGSSLFVFVLVGGATLAVERLLGLSFLHAAAPAKMQRRSALGHLSFMGLGAGTGLAPTVAMAEDERPPDISVSGRMGSRSEINGLWSPVKNQVVNGKSAYKSQTGELYMMLNDCDEMMVADKITGKCDAGFARRPKKQSWVIDGQEDAAVKTQLVSGGSDAKASAASLAGVQANRPVGKLGIELEKDSEDSAASSSRMLNKLGISAKALNSLGGQQGQQRDSYR